MGVVRGCPFVGAAAIFFVFVGRDCRCDGRFAGS